MALQSEAAAVLDWAAVSYAAILEDGADHRTVSNMRDAAEPQRNRARGGWIDFRHERE
jgi:hypothetical protein